MASRFIIAGTDTDIGKTVFAAALTLALGGNYWKPVQSGIEYVDTKVVQDITGLADEHFFPERYVLTEPLSPHLAAEIDGVDLDVKDIIVPESSRPLVIEAAGGLMVPLTRKALQINLFKRWGIPIILCARTGLGTLNHTLLSLEAMRSREMNVHGVVFIGDENEDNMRTIGEVSGAKILGRLPLLGELNPEILKAAFDDNFDIGDFS